MSRRMTWTIGVTLGLTITAVAVALADAQTAPAAPAQAMPRTADGKPDLTGVWVAGPAGGGRFNPADVDVDESGNSTRLFPSRRCGPTQVECQGHTNQSADGEFTNRARLGPDRPI